MVLGGGMSILKTSPNFSKTGAISAAFIPPGNPATYKQLTGVLGLGKGSS